MPAIQWRLIGGGGESSTPAKRCNHNLHGHDEAVSPDDGKARYANTAYQLGINYLIYAMTH